MTKTPKGRSLLFWLQKKRQRRRRRKGDPDASPKSLQDVLRALEPEVFESERARCPVTLEQWQQVVGLRIADRSMPRRLDPDGTLLVVVSSSVWAQELSMLSSTFCARLREQGHPVRTVRFLVGVLEPARRAAERFEHRFVPAPVDIPDEIQNALAQVQDDDLRDAIKRAMATSLAISKKFSEK